MAGKPHERTVSLENKDRNESTVEGSAEYSDAWKNPYLSQKDTGITLQAETMDSKRERRFPIQRDSNLRAQLFRKHRSFEDRFQELQASSGPLPDKALVNVDMRQRTKSPDGRKPGLHSRHGTSITYSTAQDSGYGSLPGGSTYSRENNVGASSLPGNSFKDTSRVSGYPPPPPPLNKSSSDSSSSSRHIPPPLPLRSSTYNFKNDSFAALREKKSANANLHSGSSPRKHNLGPGNADNLTSTKAPNFDPRYADTSGSVNVSRRISQLQEEIPRQVTTLIPPTDQPKIPERIIDIVHNPSKPVKDVTVHINLPIEEDYEYTLEEFCHLGRLGRFRQARELFQSKLEHLKSDPYVLVQYAEQLISSGDYKAFNQLGYHPDFFDLDPDNSKVQRNFQLLDLLSQRRIPNYTSEALKRVRDTLWRLRSEPIIGSTEIQLLVLSLRILQYVKTCSRENIIQADRSHALEEFPWRKLYHLLLGGRRIWDFRDLMVAAVPLFGWPELSVRMFGTSLYSEVIATIIKDWTEQEDHVDESITLGLLDLFTSLILDQAHEDAMIPKLRIQLLAQHSRILAETVHNNSLEHMKTKPFIQWIVAKSLLDMRNVPEQSEDKEFNEYAGLLLQQQQGVQLPIYVPLDSADRPKWHMFVTPASPSQRQAVKVALQMAIFTGDYTLQATCLKLLALQSQEAKPWMDVLTKLQLEIQDDKEGYLKTCLSKYLISYSIPDEESLLKELKELDRVCGSSYVECGANASLLWARGLVQGLLTAPVRVPGGSRVDFDLGDQQSEDWKRQLKVYGERLPRYITQFIQDNFDGVRVPDPMRVTFDLFGEQAPNGSNAADPGNPAGFYENDSCGVGFNTLHQDSEAEPDAPTRMVTEEPIYNEHASRPTPTQTRQNSADSSPEVTEQGDTQERERRKNAELRRRQQQQNQNIQARMRSSSVERQGRSDEVEADIYARNLRIQREAEELERDAARDLRRRQRKAQDESRNYGSGTDKLKSRLDWDDDTRLAQTIDELDREEQLARDFEERRRGPLSPVESKEREVNFHSRFDGDVRNSSYYANPEYFYSPPPPPRTPYYGAPPLPPVPTPIVRPWDPVAGWPPTWWEDAHRGTVPGAKPYLPEQDGEWYGSRDPYRYQDHCPSTDEDKKRKRDVKQGKRRSDGHNSSSDHDRSDNDHDDDESSCISPEIGYEDGLPKLDLPPQLLKKNRIKVVLEDIKEPTKRKGYVMDRNGVTMFQPGKSEAMLEKQVRSETARADRYHMAWVSETEREENRRIQAGYERRRQWQNRKVPRSPTTESGLSTPLRPRSPPARTWGYRPDAIGPEPPNRRDASPARRSPSPVRHSTLPDKYGSSPPARHDEKAKKQPAPWGFSTRNREESTLASIDTNSVLSDGKRANKVGSPVTEESEPNSNFGRGRKFSVDSRPFYTSSSDDDDDDDDDVYPPPAPPAVPTMRLSKEKLARRQQRARETDQRAAQRQQQQQHDSETEEIKGDRNTRDHRKGNIVEVLDMEDEEAQNETDHSSTRSDIDQIKYEEDKWKGKAKAVEVEDAGPEFFLTTKNPWSHIKLYESPWEFNLIERGTKQQQKEGKAAADEVDIDNDDNSEAGNGMTDNNSSAAIPTDETLRQQAFEKEDEAASAVDRLHLDNESNNGDGQRDSGVSDVEDTTQESGAVPVPQVTIANEEQEGGGEESDPSEACLIEDGKDSVSFILVDDNGGNDTEKSLDGSNASERSSGNDVAASSSTTSRLEEEGTSQGATIQHSKLFLSIFTPE